MKNVVLIDADSLAFMGKPTDSIQDIILKVDEKINNILDICQANYYCLFVSQGKYFRHDLKDKSEESGSYKSNRKYSNQNYNRVIKEYLIAKYDAVSSPNVEADDYISWMMSQKLWHYTIDFKEDGGIQSYPVSEKVYLDGKDDKDTIWEEVNLIMAAVDKDLLKSIPGRHLVYNKKQGDEWGMEWVETSLDDSLNFKAMQMLHGDSSDGISGLGGIGPKRAEKILEQWTDASIEAFILEVYINYYKNSATAIYEFQKNYRLLHLLDCDEDFMREVGYIPTLPNFKEVTKQNIEIKNEF